MSLGQVLQAVSIGKKSLKEKLVIAFSLMSIIPLLIMAYFATVYLFPGYDTDLFQISAIILTAMWLSWTGYILAKEIIIPIVNLSIETKIIAEGHYDSKILLSRDDELGDIANAVNVMTTKIRNSIGELQEYNKKTAALNVKIHRKVLTLTNLMRLGDVINSGAKFGEISDFATEMMAGELYGGFCGVFMREETGKYSTQSFFNNSGRNVDVDNIAEKLSSTEDHFSRNTHLLVDARPQKKAWQKELIEKFGQINVILYPVRSDAKIVGVIVFGNFAKGSTFNEEDVEVIKAFEKELLLGYQSCRVLERVKSLEIVDSDTGLYTFSYLEERLSDEINRAVYYQRPCSLIMVRVDDLEKYTAHYGATKGKQVLKQLGSLLNASTPPIGKVAKSDDNEFGVLLPETNKREGFELGEDIRKKVEVMEISSDANDRITVSIGIGENPIDGANAEEIMARARQYAKKAAEQGKNKVVGE